MPKLTIGISPGKFSAHILSHITTTIGVGAIITVPFLIAYWVIKWMAENADNLFQNLIEIMPFVDDISGIGLVLLLIGLYIIGLIAKNVHGKKLVRFLQELTLKAPFVRHIYGPAKGFAEIFSNNSLNQARVLGTYLFGEFVFGLHTSSIVKDGVRCVTFFYPTSPSPNSGLVFIIPETRVYEVLVQDTAQGAEPTPLTADTLFEHYLSCRHTSPGKSAYKSMPIPDLIEHCISCGTSSPKEIVTRPLACDEY